MATKKPKAAVPRTLKIPLPIPDYGFHDIIKASPMRRYLLDNLVEYELFFFLKGGSHRFKDGTPNPKGKSKAYHFWQAVSLLWNFPGSTNPLHMNPWSVRMVNALCEHDRLSIAGCASSGKSQILAVWSIVNYLADPLNTRVLVTSTSLKDSRGRIWGDIEKRWQTMVAEGPGKLVSSSGLIRYYDHFTGREDSLRGLMLLAGDKSKTNESIGKVKGFKATRVFLVADELPDLSKALVAEAESNLSSNPYFHFCGTGNPTSPYDPHGEMSEPEAGWSSITENDYEWQGKKAYVIRFDAEKSPNFGPEGERWPYLMTHERLASLRRDLGERSLRYYAMVKGFWFFEAGQDNIYSPAMLQSYRCFEKAVFKGQPTVVAGFDPSFTNGGDRSMLTIGRVGMGVEGQVLVERVASIPVYEDATNKDTARTEQIAARVIQLCEEHGVKPENLAVDASGAGSPWCDMLSVKWRNNNFKRVQFGGSAEDKEQYFNKVSELWFSGQALVRSSQIRGLDLDLAKEMTLRTYEMRGKRVMVTPKEDLRTRLGNSPDNADSFFLMLDIAQRKHKLTATERVGGGGAVGSGMKKRFRDLASIYDAA